MWNVALHTENHKQTRISFSLTAFKRARPARPDLVVGAVDPVVVVAVVVPQLDVLAVHVTVLAAGVAVAERERVLTGAKVA